MDRREFLKTTACAAAATAIAATPLAACDNIFPNLTGKKMKVLMINGSPRADGNTFTALGEIGYRGWYSMELALRRFGGSPEMVMAYAAFAVKVMRELLRERRPA